MMTTTIRGLDVDTARTICFIKLILMAESWRIMSHQNEGQHQYAVSSSQKEPMVRIEGSALRVH